MEVARANKNEFAVGIPMNKPMSIMPKINEPSVFEFGVHDHQSIKAGRHYDLRLGDRKSGKAYSWAIPSATLPEPGERPVLAIPTFIHSIRYMDFEGIIGSGYGKGVVKLPHRGKAIIHYSSPQKVKFTANINGKPNTFVLFKPKDFKNSYLLMNVTHKEKTAQDFNPNIIQQIQSMPQIQHKFDESQLPFSIRFLKKLPYHLLGAGALEFGGAWAMKNLARRNPALAERNPQLYKFLMTRRPSLIMAGLVGAGSAAATAGLSMLRDRLKSKKQSEVPYVENQTSVI